MLKGSHKLGRIEHKRVGEQIGADVERVEQVMKVSEKSKWGGGGNRNNACLFFL